jgi:uncharacterized membrane protein (UPF0127 family)
MDKKKSFPIAIIVVFIAVLIPLLSKKNTPIKTPIDDSSYVEVGDVKVRVDIADSAAEQEQGLSGRAGLAGDEGMLFVFETSDKHYFWMKDMNFAIDMIFLDPQGKIVYIKNNATPESYPNTFGEGDSKYVLEVVSGFSAKNNLKIGDTLKLDLK